METVVTRDWTLGYSHDPEGFTLLQFSYPNRDPIGLAIPHEIAEQIAKAILENLKNPPPRPGRLS